MSLLAQVLRAGLAGALVTFALLSAAQKPPAWFAEPPRDTPEAWYGTGEGPDPDAARRAALRAVAARLRSVISGSVESKVSDTNGRVDRRDSVQTSESILRTEFSRVTVESSARSAVGYVVLVKVDRPAFVRDTRASLELADKPIAEAEAAAASASTLEQFLALRRVAPSIDQASELTLLLMGAGADGDLRGAQARYAGLKQRLQKLSSQLVFELRARPEDADVAKAVAGFLAGQGMRSATAPTAGANVLTIETQVRQDELFGDKLMKLKVRFAVADAQGRAVASRETDVSGASRYDFRGAREAAVGKLSASLRDSKGLSALGFNE